MRFLLSAVFILIPLMVSSCFKQEFGGLGIQVPAGSKIVSNENPEHLRVTSEYMIPILVNAVKELSSELEILKEKIKNLETK